MDIIGVELELEVDSFVLVFVIVVMALAMEVVDSEVKDAGVGNSKIEILQYDKPWSQRYPNTDISSTFIMDLHSTEYLFPHAAEHLWSYLGFNSPSCDQHTFYADTNHL